MGKVWRQNEDIIHVDNLEECNKKQLLESLTFLQGKENMKTVRVDRAGTRTMHKETGRSVE